MGSRGKGTHEVAGVWVARRMVLEKMKGHLERMGMLCSEQSWALAAPSSFDLWEAGQDTLSWC